MTAIRRRADPMVRTRWALVTAGTVALLVTAFVASDVTVRFTAGMAWAIGMIILGISEVIIVRTRKDK
ncbi:hypothetical protein [Actinomadura xylanilytica]|uniref:hypothetical protein n=1 Tax=Actinomadura xylanilytica TaxID=887459 RepID=UPI00255ADA0B|nr:hypothetical protein [Actinomadura xylanilytica]MDL4777864.1 hypothetical protein [Actinomadura xylanilytica]